MYCVLLLTLCPQAHLNVERKMDDICQVHFCQGTRDSLSLSLSLSPVFTFSYRISSIELNYFNLTLFDERCISVCVCVRVCPIMYLVYGACMSFHYYRSPCVPVRVPDYGFIDSLSLSFSPFSNGPGHHNREQSLYNKKKEYQKWWKRVEKFSRVFSGSHFPVPFVAHLPSLTK